MPDDIVKDRAGYRLVNTNPNRARLSHSAAQNLANNTLTKVKFDTERYDSNVQHSTSTAGLTGTVSVTAGSTSIVGTGTAFRSQLYAGSLITVGSPAQQRVISGVTNDTAATVSAAWGSSTSGTTASSVNTGLVCTTEGTYSIWATIGFASSTAGKREVYLKLNDANYIGAAIVAPAPGDATLVNIQAGYDLSLWDYVEVVARQNSGSTLDIVAMDGQSPIFGWHRVG